MYDVYKPNYLELLAPIEDLPGTLNSSSEPNSPAAISAAAGIVLRHMRHFLDMEVAFVAEFEKTTRLFRYVDTDPGFRPIASGDRKPLSAGYCKKAVDGLIPEMAADTDAVAAVQSIPETRAVPVRAYIAVPLTLSHAELYGTLCCFSRKPHAAMDAQDHRRVRGFAALIGTWITAGRRLADPFGWLPLPSFQGRDRRIAATRDQQATAGAPVGSAAAG